MKHLLSLSTLVFTLAFVTTGVAQPVITSNPKDATLCQDSCVALTAAAVGDNVSFQWQVDSGAGFVNIATVSATTDSMVVCQGTSAAPDSAWFRCVVTDANGFRDTSLEATVWLDSCLAPKADFTFTFEQANVCFTNTSFRAETVIWNFGDGTTNSENANTPCNDYGTAWYYDVTLYAYNDYGSDQKTTTIDLVGIEEANRHMEIFPNPVLDQLNIRYSNAIESVHCIDALGNTVQSWQAIPNIASINLRQLPSGTYMLLIKSENRWMQHRLVKQ